MTVELKLVGHRCNLQCAYCYEQGARHTHTPLDKAAVLRSVDAHGQRFHLFGGEPLLSPLAELEEFFRLGLEKHGGSGIQTNGSLITPAHIDLFKQYKVEVGISIDGPGGLNDARRAGADATRKMTAQTEAAIEALLDAGVVPSLIVTLSQANVGSIGRLTNFCEWLRYLRGRGVRHVNPHLLERNGAIENLILEDSDLMSVLDTLWRVQDESPALTLSIFSDVLHMLRGDDTHVVCIHRSCDPWNTPSCTGIEPNGEPSMCGRVHKDGMNWNPADGHSYERQLALEVTPQDQGGCQGCPYWVCCTGGCPGGAIDGDWRNKDAYCAVWMWLYAEGERRLRAAGIQPISQHPHLWLYAQLMREQWVLGCPPSLSKIVQASAGGVRLHGPGWANPQPHGDGHGDHLDSVTPRHSDTSAHGDVPHGDAHGDHTDGGPR